MADTDLSAPEEAARQVPRTPLRPPHPPQQLTCEVAGEHPDRGSRPSGEAKPGALRTLVLGALRSLGPPGNINISLILSSSVFLNRFHEILKDSLNHLDEKIFCLLQSLNRFSTGVPNPNKDVS